MDRLFKRDIRRVMRRVVLRDGPCRGVRRVARGESPGEVCRKRNTGRIRYGSARSGVSFQFRDLRAKASTDTEDLAHAQRLLGHKSCSTTEIYTRQRRGDLGKPLSRSRHRGAPT